MQDFSFIYIVYIYFYCVQTPGLSLSGCESSACLLALETGHTRARLIANDVGIALGKHPYLPTRTVHSFFSKHLSVPLHHLHPGPELDSLTVPLTHALGSSRAHRDLSCASSTSVSLSIEEPDDDSDEEIGSIDVSDQKIEHVVAPIRDILKIIAPRIEESSSIDLSSDRIGGTFNWQFKPGQKILTKIGSNEYVWPTQVLAQFRSVLRGWLLSRPKSDRLARVRSNLILNLPLSNNSLHEFRFIVIILDGCCQVARIRGSLRWTGRRGGPRSVQWPLDENAEQCSASVTLFSLHDHGDNQVC